MKLAATGLLVLMAAIFAASRSFEQQYPWLSFVKAFAEAAMVGGLADWFAVTALFRHPLGLPAGLLLRPVGGGLTLGKVVHRGEKTFRVETA